MNSVVYATAGSGKDAELIGWIDFGTGLTMNSGDTVTIENSIPGGYTISFNMSYILDGGASNLQLVSTSAPIWDSKDVPFGKIAYTGLNSSSVVIYENTGEDTYTTITVNISNLIVSDSTGNRINNYTIVLADAETTNKDETWQATTDGGGWILFDTMPSVSGTTDYAPSLSGLSTSSIYEQGQPDVNMADVASYVYTTFHPTKLTLVQGMRQSGEGAAIGIMLNHVGRGCLFI